ncbi:MAG: pyridoxal-phosphate dependent enzyme, partial [Planctomycetota bacterium]|nr:pyridoxal-phosphate dependent enzyme [Planctomycetota bacterium]
RKISHMLLDSPERALRRAVPGLVARYGPLGLADLPTPVRALPDLADAWGLSAFLVKDDAVTSAAYGGTKVRALEWLLGAARRAGRDGVVTIGPWGSHHAVATATFAEQSGLGCRLVLFPQPDGPEVAWARTHLPKLAACNWCGWLGFPLRLLEARSRRLGATRPFPIAAGGTSPLGVLGAAEGALEVAYAIKAGAMPCPDDVVVAAGSCGTAAGLLLGFGLAGPPYPRVVAVRVTAPVIARAGRVRALARKASRLVAAAGGPKPRDLPELAWIDDLAGAGYGRATEVGREVLSMGRDRGGLDLETTYTAKALSVAHLRRLEGRSVLFWNTFAGAVAND